MQFFANIIKYFQDIRLEITAVQKPKSKLMMNCILNGLLNNFQIKMKILNANKNIRVQKTLEADTNIYQQRLGVFDEIDNNTTQDNDDSELS